MSDKNAPSTERLLLSMGLFLVALFTSIDLIEDRLEGASVRHLLAEGLIVTLSTAGMIYLLSRIVAEYQSRTRALSSERDSALLDAAHWRSEARSLLEGLGAAIEKQFSMWKLSEAEKEVALLLLKGFSHKEIAAIRSTSEKTVRQQSTQVYQKSQLEGRAQLSAFFLEDLLLPSEPHTSSKTNSKTNIG